MGKIQNDVVSTSWMHCRSSPELEKLVQMDLLWLQLLRLERLQLLWF